MTYKGYTISAEERLFNLIEVDEQGEITGVVEDHDWTEAEYSYFVRSHTGSMQDFFDTFREAKEAIDGWESATVTR